MKPLSIRREGAFLGAKSGNLPLITTQRVSRDYESRPCIEPSFIAASYQEVQNVIVKAKAKVIVNIIVKVKLSLSLKRTLSCQEVSFHNEKIVLYKFVI